MNAICAGLEHLLYTNPWATSVFLTPTQAARELSSMGLAAQRTACIQIVLFFNSGFAPSDPEKGEDRRHWPFVLCSPGCCVLSSKPWLTNFPSRKLIMKELLSKKQKDLN